MSDVKKPTGYRLTKKEAEPAVVKAAILPRNGKLFAASKRPQKARTQENQGGDKRA